MRCVHVNIKRVCVRGHGYRCKPKVPYDDVPICVLFTQTLGIESANYKLTAINYSLEACS